jgi:uncharacterized protein (DUF1778 family)
MIKRNRNVNLTFRVSEDEYELIRQNMEQTGIQNMRAYLLKMALNGYIVQVDLSDVREFVFLLKNISNNINQVAKRANETRNIYESDVQELCHNFDKIWDNVNDILQKLAKI